MLKNKKILLMILLVFIALAIPNLALAGDEHVTTTEINGATAKWEYYLNESNQIIKLKCLNPANLTGSITVPSELEGKKVIALGGEAFKGAISITGVTIPNSVKEIGYSAFEDCKNLKKINLGSIEKISFDVFKGCTSLKSITIPKTLKGGSVTPCLNNSNITNITFEEGLTVIPSSLCENTGVTEITIPNSVKEIGYNAFKDCKNLSKINLGSIEKISFDVFKGCTSLKSITIPKTLKGGSVTPCLNNSNITNITFEEGLTVIPSSLCENTGVTEITIPNSVKKIENNAFKDCKNLKKITILDNVTNISFDVFKNHDNDLTIYCYKDSEAAKYAIKNDIKYVYLTKENNENSDNDDKNTENEDKSKDFEKHRYEIIEKTLTWKEAKAYCEKLGGHLVTITSKEEQEYIEKLISKYNNEKARFWMGATDEEKEGVWKWITGEEFSYTNWGEKEPDSFFSSQNYMLMHGYELETYGIKFGQWDDVSNTDKATYFICEWDEEKTNDNNNKQPNETKDDDDDSIAKGTMPYTGGTFFVIITVMGIAAVAIYVYKRNNDLKGI